MLKRIFLILLQVLAIYIVTFMLLHLIPGDPIQVMLGESASLADQNKLRMQLGLDKSIYLQLSSSLVKVFQGDFGVSILNHKPVLEQLINAGRNTYILAGASLLIALSCGLMGGIISAKFHNSAVDKIIMSISIFFISIPHFFLGPLLILFFSIWLGWFPVNGIGSFSSIVLPAFTLALGLIAIIVKLTRNCMLELIDSDIVRTARAKGLSEWAVLINHVFRLVLIPIISVLGMQFGSLLSGAVITETIFSWNGIGMLLVDSIQTRDYPITQACIFVIALSYVVVNILTDFIYKVADPRMRTSKIA
ncbi:MAG: ABC transporter permease [Betaproteobacteria bacterium]|jgi:peptide/nickel transport system permease protein|nr:ABC transporter permease [Nitrosomonadales bacterium]MCH9782193.1 ABC transporter permease [Betaproteobacteria bacterium]MDA9087678.1 ABC transporter permease [Methylophilaceae bacterium]MBT5411631.1 ABC transporter permease [Nitrosomonadales bacterium]MCH9842064.1 ABC transporter permease [Betaproteobacteria bacterium]